MYLKKMIYENVGPISNCNIAMSFHDNDNPKPVILVGKNGSGKSILLSNIIDSFYEFAGQSFNNVRISQDSGGYKYYKVLSSSQVKIDEKYLCSYLEYENDNEKIEYLFKVGEISFDEFCGKHGITINSALNWNNDDQIKKSTHNKDLFEKIFREETICVFEPSRYESPYWKGADYSIIENEHIHINENFTGTLNKPICVTNMQTTNLKWILDVIVDSRCETISENGKLSILPNHIANITLLSLAKKNIDLVISEILKEQVYFNLNNRSFSALRLNIIKRSNNKIKVPRLDALSSGEIALFDIFSTIIRYADTGNISNSINLNEIKGIVVVDEIELHLHSSLQKEVLPRLIKLFPKVQFIITSHSPLFLLGMQEHFGDDGFDIIEMPNGNRISAEDFSEFHNAYSYFEKTEKFKSDLEKATLEIKARNSRTLIVTEGSSDWKHMKKALEKLNHEYDDLDFDFLEYEPKNSEIKADIKLEMGNQALCQMCDSFSKLHQDRKIIFIADCDDRSTSNILGKYEEELSFRVWGNNVYSFILPIPEHRTSTPNITIEHYYTDEEIKTEKTFEGNIKRRLFMGNEFDIKGLNQDLELFYDDRNKCGAESICIIDGSNNKKVYKQGEYDNNLALSKENFAQYILNDDSEFTHINHEHFRIIFEVIKEIIELPDN